MKMLARVAEGWVRGGGEEPEVLHLTKPADYRRAVEAFGEADTVVLGMPLYTDSMPGLVKLYIEALAPFIGRAGNPRIGFLVQSGFAEALHSRPLESYLARLATRLGCEYAGTIVKGSGESLQAMPDEASKKLWARMNTLGESLAANGRFDPAALEQVAGTERFSAGTAAVMGVVLRAQVTQFYWNSQLRKNGAWDKRFAAPYGTALAQ
jgi:hypothetical protein